MADPNTLAPAAAGPFVRGQPSGRSDPRTCPVEGCETPIAQAHHCLCDAHWDALTADQRAEVRRRWRDWQRDNPKFAWRTRSDFILAVNNAIKAAGRKPERPEEMPA